MVFGFAFIAVGYSIFYWGLHHFCGLDCPTGKMPNGQTNNNPCNCRYSLIDLLGIPRYFGISGGNPLQVGLGGVSPLPFPGSGGWTGTGKPGSVAGGPGTTAALTSATQPQNPNNNTTYSALG